MNIIGRRNIYFVISALILIPGIIAIFMWGLKFGIDFTGGSRLEIESKNKIDKAIVEDILKSKGITEYSFQESGDKSLSIRTKELELKKKDQVLSELKKKDKDIKEKSFETVGPVIGSETSLNALKAVGLAGIAIAIVALLHDVFVVIGVFAILGHFLNAEVDSLFITALLTVMGFSVHDTIVVFDRIRENLKRTQGVNFEQLVNNSTLETLNRSLNTSLTVVFVLSTMLLFGGESIRWFMVALLVGIISGTYSSIFTASPLLVVWNNWDRKRFKRS